jgi:hypothetical protein
MGRAISPGVPADRGNAAPVSKTCIEAACGAGDARLASRFGRPPAGPLFGRESMFKSFVAGGVAAAAIMVGVNASQAQEKITYLLHSTPGNVFWQAVKLGMDDACAQIQADCQMVFLQQDGNFQEQLNNFEAAIAAESTGIILTFAGGNVFDEALQRAADAGIPVIASNVDHPDGNFRQSYVGQDLEVAGYDPRQGPVGELPGRRPGPRPHRRERPRSGLVRDPRRRHRAVREGVPGGQPRSRDHLRADRRRPRPGPSSASALPPTSRRRRPTPTSTPATGMRRRGIAPRSRQAAG